MNRLAARVWRTIRRLDLMPAGSRVVAAVSGGGDSVALAHVLRQLHSLERVRFVGIAHVNHGLRGEASDEDQAFCQQLASSFGVAFVAQRVDVRALARERRLSVEAAGHLARYDALARAAAALQAEAVALGHTRDDQAETVLLRLIRGAGLRGLAGMYPRNGLFVRPMLECSREHVRQFLADQGIAYREDATNNDLSVPRNRVRHVVIPAMEQLSPRVVNALGRTARIVQDEVALLDEMASTAAGRLLFDDAAGVRMDRARLAAEPVAIARRVIGAALERIAGGRFIGFRHVEAVLRLARATAPSRAELALPGHVVVECSGDRLLLRRFFAPRPVVETNSFRFSLSIPGEVLSPAGWVVSAERVTRDDAGGLEGVRSDRSGCCGHVDASALHVPLAVRSWRAGDRFRPLGLAGSKKLQDFFVDRKVPRQTRGAIPIVADAGDRIVWVAGHVISEDFRVTARTGDVVILKLKYWRNGT